MAATIPDVGAFADVDPWVLAQGRRKLPVPHVHGNDVRGAALEQHVGKAARSGANVEHAESARIQSEVVQGESQLAPAASHVARRFGVHLDSRVGRHGAPGSPNWRVVDPHEAVTHVLARLGSRGGQSAADQLDIQPVLHRPRLGFEGALGAGHLALAARIERGGRVEGARQRLEDGFGLVMVVAPGRAAARAPPPPGAGRTTQ